MIYFLHRSCGSNINELAVVEEWVDQFGHTVRDCDWGCRCPEFDSFSLDGDVAKLFRDYNWRFPHMSGMAPGREYCGDARKPLEDSGLLGSTEVLEICDMCEPEFEMDKDNRCQLKLCTCGNGTPVEPTVCDYAGGEQCAGCVDGHYLTESNLCLPDK